MSDDLIRNLVDYLPSPFVTLDGDLRIVSANAAAERLMGAASVKLIGKKVSDTVTIDERALEALVSECRKSIEHRSSAALDVQGNSCNVTALNCGEAIGLLFDGTHNGTEFAPLLRDGAEVEDRRLFSELFDRLGEAVLLSNRVGQIIRVNTAACNILGMTENELLALRHDDPIWKAIREDGTPIPIAELPGTKALNTKRAVSNEELGIVRPDGSLVWILESAAPIIDEHGEVVGVLVTFPEVTSTVKQRQTLRELSEKYQLERDRANESNRLKSAFLANMSHEIRTPMTAILGFSDVLASELSGKVSEQHYTFLRSINVSGKRLLNLINDILDLSKIESGRIEMAMDELEVRTEIESAITPLSWIAKQKSLAVHVQEYPNRLIIQGDRHRFGQVLTNIISNAIKFTRAGSITVRTFVQTSAASTEAKQVVIEIEDTGIGISPTFLPHLFEEFRQEHAGATKEFGGTGLGLAISRRLISLMGGAIQVRSQQGVGTVFSLIFPLVAEGRTAKPLDLTNVQAPPVTSAPKPKPVPQTSSAALVMVVEDNAETQRLLEAYLKGQYRIAQATSANSLYQTMEKELPDVIIMDINLPGKDGLTITREIRTGDACPNVPIIALTAFAMTGDRQKCLDAGCNYYLSKPATRREVLDVVAKALNDVRQKAQS